jgi:hypothetical protein
MLSGGGCLFPFFFDPFCLVIMYCIVVRYIICIVSLIVIWSGLSWGGAGGVGLVGSLLFCSLLFSYYVLYRCSLYNVYSIVDRYMIWIIMQRGKWCSIGCFLFFWYIISVIYRWKCWLSLLFASLFRYYFLLYWFFIYIISVRYRPSAITLESPYVFFQSKTSQKFYQTFKT